MTVDECFYLGLITKPFGYKGELVLFLDVDNLSDYTNLDSVFVEVRGRLIPYFIESIRIHGKNTVVRFADLTVEEAEALVSCKLYLPTDLLPPLEGTNFYYHEVIGYQVKDQIKGDIGCIRSIMDQGPQAIMVIEDGKNEILIPIVDQFILSLDREKKQMLIAAPEGLIDFYIS